MNCARAVRTTGGAWPGRCVVTCSRPLLLASGRQASSARSIAPTCRPAWRGHARACPLRGGPTSRCPCRRPCLPSRRAASSATCRRSLGTRMARRPAAAPTRAATLRMQRAAGRSRRAPRWPTTSRGSCSRWAAEGQLRQRVCSQGAGAGVGHVGSARPGRPACLAASVRGLAAEYANARAAERSRRIVSDWLGQASCACRKPGSGLRRCPRRGSQAGRQGGVRGPALPPTPSARRRRATGQWAAGERD